MCSSLGQPVARLSVNKYRAEAIPEGETELETIRVSCLLNKGLEGVDVFIGHPLPLTILVLILVFIEKYKYKSHDLI